MTQARRTPYNFVVSDHSILENDQQVMRGLLSSFQESDDANSEIQNSVTTASSATNTTTTTTSENMNTTSITGLDNSPKSKYTFIHGISNQQDEEEGQLVWRDKHFFYIDSNATTKKLYTHPMYWETIIVRFLAGIALHIQSLYYTFVFHGFSFDAIWCTLGAGVEGAFFISIFIASFRGIRCYLCTSNTNKKIKSQFLPSISRSTLCSEMNRSLLGRLTVCIFLLVSATAVILSDVGFQQKTGGERPDMWVILAHLKNFSSGVKGEFKDSSKGAMTLIYGCVTSLSVTLLICLLQEKRIDRCKAWKGGNDILLNTKMPKQTIMLFGISFALMSFLYLTDSWMPIFHTYASVCGGLFLSPPGSKAMASALKIDPSKIVPPRSDAPNIVVILHESLSGELMMTHESAATATPFFHEMLKSDQEYFVFENARTVSGDTVDAITVIQSGCNPMDHKESRDYALKTTLATEFKSRGYDTVSFSSRELNLAGTKWFMTQHQLTTNFDKVYDPYVTQDPLENPPGQDDRKLVENFLSWLEERRQINSDGAPFFAQFYYFNAHYPFFNNEGSEHLSRLDGMLETVDQSIERIIKILKETGQLDNTIVVGSADHGERRTPTKYGRLREWSKDILHVPIYMRIPQGMFDKSEHLIANLRYNTQQLVSTLDLYPTLMHMLTKHPLQDYPVADDHCVRGYDLLNQRIDSDRVAWSFPGVSKDFQVDNSGNMAIHQGTASSLLNRFGWPQDNALSIVEYSPVLGSKYVQLKGENQTKTLQEWKSLIKSLNHTEHAPIFTKRSRYMVELYRSLGFLSFLMT